MPESRAIEKLSKEPYISLATFRRNGKAVQTPVWFAVLSGKLYVVTDGTSAKVKRIRATQRVRVARCNVWGGVSGRWIDGTGRILREKGLIKRAHAALCEKYGWQMGLLDTVSRVSGRIGRRAYLELSVGAPRVAPE
jgi:PPOX class probable F420-dependent enzyme